MSDPDETLHWVVEDGELSVETVRERAGAFEDFEALDVGETDAVAVTENVCSPHE